MAQTIDTQVRFMKVQKYLNSSQDEMTKSMQRISSGLRVNKANDDAAGLAISEHMNTLVRGMNVGIRNANDGISMSQTADGGLKQVDNLLQRMRELALQSSNGTNSSADRENLNAEFTSLNEEISRIASTTKFNGETVLANDGSSVNYQLGPHTGEDDTVSIDLVAIESLSADISTYSASQASIGAIDSMIADVASSRANFGAVQSRFESAMDNLQVGVENQSAARGRIVDADFAVEAAMLARSKIMQQAGAAMSSQANVTPRSVTQLLG
ncbi:MAG: flagellin [Granulosicoccus sp.]